jgi:hypothetical protein
MHNANWGSVSRSFHSLIPTVMIRLFVVEPRWQALAKTISLIV